MPNAYIELIDSLILQRQALKISQRELASAAGVSWTEVALMEQKKHMVQLRALLRINGLLSERIQTLLKYATTSLEPEQESKLIEEITSAINHIKMENEQIAHHRQELEKAMRDIEQHDLEVAQKQELKDIQGHHFGGLSI